MERVTAPENNYFVWQEFIRRDSDKNYDAIKSIKHNLTLPNHGEIGIILSDNYNASYHIKGHNVIILPSSIYTFDEAVDLAKFDIFDKAIGESSHTHLDNIKTLLNSMFKKIESSNIGSFIFDDIEAKVEEILLALFYDRHDELVLAYQNRKDG
jgi:hypothetical protein